MFFTETKRKNGYTLIEMLIYTALIGIIILMVSGIFMTINRANSKATSLIEVNSSITGAMERMIYEIQNAQYVYTPTSHLDTTTDPQLSLATSVSASAGENITYVDFYVENNILFVKTEGVAPVALTPSNIYVQSLQFNYLKNDPRESIEIDFIARPNNSLNSGALIHLTTTVALRS